MKTIDFDYPLPSELIAQTPIEHRDQSRLLILNRTHGSIEHHRFFEIVDYLKPGDVVVCNNSRVIPARLSGKKTETGGKLEVLLLRRLRPNVWEALVKPGKRIKTGSKLIVVSSNGRKPDGQVTGEVIESIEDGRRVVSFSDEALLPELGRMPLPPYIHTPLQQPERYQTVYADRAGSVAAPTAGLHFTPDLIQKIRQKGIQLLFVTLHIGLDTFMPVREDDPSRHHIHREYGIVTPEVVEQVSHAKKEGRRVVCIGTTSVRILEEAAQHSSPSDLQPFEGWVSLYILPGYQFKVADAMVTNFHLPKSTLLMLVSAFAGKDLILRAYQEAIAQEYRFYSFGDAMLII